MSDRAFEIDERLSWARRVGDEVDIRLWIPHAAPAHVASVQLVSADGHLSSRTSVTTQEGAVLVSLRVPHTDLGRSTWRMRIQTPAGDFVPLLARLVAAPTCPVALLPGPAPGTRMPSPVPRSRRSPARVLAARLPTPVRRALVRARSMGRGAAGRR